MSGPDATTHILEGSGSLVLLVVTTGAPILVALADPCEIRIGRGSTADVSVDDASLSRLHAVVRVRGGQITVEDLGSSNGTIVRGTKIATTTAVEAGEAIHLGTVLAIVQRRSGSIADRVRPAASAAPQDELVAKIAASTISVLLLGETGVGKEVMAERIHNQSARKHQPLVKLNCAALMPSVLESELFGHERGAFTGAIKDKPGLVETADGGTLFLDEIGEADPEIQVKLLRVLEARETQRIGAVKPRIVDVRFIAATNRVPHEQIEAGTLRPDLYYRLAGFTITIPPLRERRGQIAGLAHELLARHPGITLDPRALHRLQQHPWPGNVRELRNVLERCVVLAESPVIDAAAVEAALQLEPTAGSPVVVDDSDRARVLATLTECGGNQTMAAERLGMSRRALVYRLQAWGMTKPRRR